MAETETDNVITLQPAVTPEPKPGRKKDTRAAARQAKRRSKSNGDRDGRRRRSLPPATVTSTPSMQTVQTVRSAEGSIGASPAQSPERTASPNCFPLPAPATTGTDVTAYTAAIALAGAAAWFSLRGMVVLFPGAPVSVICMAMEGAKLVTAGWLARRWRTTLWVWRLVLATLVAGLAVINAAGVCAQLVAADVGERGAAQSAVET
jgi:hypothetical protein